MLAILLVKMIIFVIKTEEKCHFSLNIVYSQHNTKK